MQRIANRLNKVKHPVSPTATSMPIPAAHLLINAVAEKYDSLRSKTVAIFNCGSGLLAAGAALLEPQFMVLLLGAPPDPVILENIKEFRLCCDLVLGGKTCLADGSFDIAIVGPQLLRAKGVHFIETAFAAKVAREAYALHKAEFADQLEQAFPGVEIVQRVDIVLPGSSRYSKAENKPTPFVLVRLKRQDVKLPFKLNTQ